MGKLFEPDYGLNLNRLEIPVDPYRAFKCDVPNLSTSLYFVINDSFYKKSLPQAQLPEGVIVDSLSHVAAEKPDLDRKSTRLNSSHANISYAVFCLKKNKNAN